MSDQSEFRKISTEKLYYMLHNSTISDDNENYANYINTIETGDLIAKFELFCILGLSQMNMFYEGAILSMKVINDRLDFIMLKD